LHLSGSNACLRRPTAAPRTAPIAAPVQDFDCGLPLTRAQVDRIFLEILRRDGFAPRWLYYALVRIFGGGFRLFTRWKRGQIGSCVMLATTPAP